MLQVLILWLTAPISIYFSLIVLNNVYLTFILFYGVVCLLIPIIDIIGFHKMKIKDYLRCIGFTNFKGTLIPSLILGLVFCLSIFIFFVLLQKYVLPIQQVQTVLDEWNINKKYVIPFMFIMIVCNSIFEEIYWRGYIYKKLENKLRPVYVILLTSFFYASYHPITIINLFPLLYAIIFTAVIFGTGIFWGYMRKKYNSIYFPVISHLLADLGIMLIYFKYFGI